MHLRTLCVARSRNLIKLFKPVDSQTSIYGVLLAIALLLTGIHYQARSQPLPNIYAVMTNGGELNGGTIVRFAPSENAETMTSANFGARLLFPRSRNVLAPNGYLYNFGSGGNAGKGGLFRIMPDGSGYEQLHDFGSLNGSTAYLDGRSNSSIAIGTDNVIYGSTDAGGMYGSGVVYRINGDGTRYEKLVDFPYASLAGIPDPSNLILGANGLLYGTHGLGSTLSGGFYKLSTDGSGFTEIFKLHDYKLANPKHLHWGRDGRLYAIARIEHSNQYVLFRINTDGSGYEVLHLFDQSIDQGVIEASDGLLYGTSGGGGDFDNGYVYRCATDGSDFEIIHHFNNDAGAPILGVREGPGGLLYGIASSGGTYGHGVVYKMSDDGTGFAIVDHLPFSGAKSELAFTTDVIGDNICLFTTEGGSDNKGTLYRIHETTGSIVHNFVEDFSLAVSPFAGLARVDDLSMHMLAMRENVFNTVSLVKVSVPEGAVQSVTDNLDGISSNGISQIAEDDHGNYYWINSFMGSYGSLVRQSTSGSIPERVYEFTQATGYTPFTDIIVHDGYVYGTCSQGGTNNSGVIYRVKSNGTGYQVLYALAQYQVMPSLAIGADQRIYAADAGIFSMNLDGSDYRQLRALPTDRSVSAPLTIIGDQIFGVVGRLRPGDFSGSAFNMNIDGSGYRDLHTFSGTDGDSPFTALYPYPGKLLGATYRGGKYGWGTLFAIDMESGVLTTFKHLDHKTGYGVSMRLTGTCDGISAPTISVDGNKLTSSSKFGNQWFRNGVAVTNGVHPTVEVTESGEYRVVTAFAGCRSALSEGIVVTVDGIDEEAGRGLYPNPTSGKVVVATGTKEAETVQIAIRNTMGLTVVSYEGSGGNVVIDMGGKAAGLYVVSIRTHDGPLVQRKLAVR